MTLSRSPAVVTHAPPGETYPEFTVRVAENGRRVKAKCDALDQFHPRCTACGETCAPIDSGSRCKENNMSMISRWAEEKGRKEFYRLGHFGGSWHCQERALAALLDRVRAGDVTT